MAIRNSPRFFGALGALDRQFERNACFHCVNDSVHRITVHTAGPGLLGRPTHVSSQIHCATERKTFH